MDTATAAASGGTIPLSPSLLGSDTSPINLDFLGSSRKRKASDDMPFLPPPPLLSAENSANGASGNNNNGTLTARAEPGSFRIKIQRSTPRQGGSRLPTPAATPSNPGGGLQFPMQFNSLPTFMPQPFPPGMPTMPSPFMQNHVMNQMNFQTQMLQQQQQQQQQNAAFISSLGPPPPAPQTLLPQNSLLGNEGQDLGPPPSAPPRMTVEHSLMGGGIEVQPARAVDTRNFDWNRKGGAASTISEDDEGGEEQSGGGRPRSESLPNISLGFLDGLTLQSESSFFKEV